MKFALPPLALIPAALLALAAPTPGHAFGRAKTAETPAPAPEPGAPAVPSGGRRVIEPRPIGNVTIELPDASRRDFGEDFSARLTTRLLDGGRFVLSDTVAVGGSLKAAATLLAEPENPYRWASSITPVAIVRMAPVAWTFATGGRGTRTQYGFDERNRTAWDANNEYPLRQQKLEPNWFDRAFDRDGGATFGSQSGLDLGEGLQVDFLFAWLKLKYAQYRTRLALDLEIEEPLTGARTRHAVDVRGEGFFYDVAGGYMEYSGAIRIARTDALLKAFDRAMLRTTALIEERLSPAGGARLPAAGRLDELVKDATYPQGTAALLGTGPRAQIPAGTRLRLWRPSGEAERGLELEVAAISADGSVARVVAGSAAALARGGLWVESSFVGAQPSVASASMAVARVALASAGSPLRADLPAENFAASALGQWSPGDSRLQAFFRSLLGTVVLPYRLWRYGQYDRPYAEAPDADGDSPVENGRFALQERAEAGTATAGDAAPGEAFMRAQREAWGRSIGLDQVAPSSGSGRPVVAVISTGVDYNHPLLHASIWTNPWAWTDALGRSDRHGWDFVSGDERAFDDGYQGTEVAGLVVTVAPGARILPIKAINPFGVTAGSWLAGAIRYAIDHEARVIVLPWATRRSSVALRAAVEAAVASGATVVCAAGDRGDALSEVPAYPAAWASELPGLVSVTGLRADGDLVQTRGQFANLGEAHVRIGAPGESIGVARPRRKTKVSTGTSLAAAIVAGAAARLWSREGDEVARTEAGPRVRERLLDDAVVEGRLRGKVEGGRRLWVRD